MKQALAVGEMVRVILYAIMVVILARRYLQGEKYAQEHSLYLDLRRAKDC